MQSQAVIFTKQKMEQTIIIITGLQVKDFQLENIPSAFTWYYNNDQKTDDLKQWVADQLNI